jgi:hypothetical protein
MTTLDDWRFGVVRVRLHVTSGRAVRYECMVAGERVNFRYSKLHPEIWWETRNQVLDHEDCIEQVVAFILDANGVGEAWV